MTPITIVAGLGRSGSSLVMQMLAAAGHPIYGPDQARAPAYEHPNAMTLPARHDWLADAEGRAVKVLDPQRHRLPAQYRYRVIWCARDPGEQAKSQLKFLAAMFGAPVGGRQERRGMASSNLRDKHRAWEAISLLPHAPMIAVRFEDLIGDPLTSARLIAEFVGIPPEAVPKMAACVRPRSPRCYDGMMEIEMLAEARP